MSAGGPRPSRASAVRTALLALALLLLLCLRRWAQAAHPQVWNEDAGTILPQELAAGPLSLLYPLNGYLVLMPRLISFAALSVSPTYYPEIGTLLAWAFIVAVGVAAAVSPLAVRGGALLAFATFLVPSDAEVFGIPLYTLWWAGILPVLAALWRPGERGTSWRVAFVVLGGLSSPLAFVTLPLFLARAIVFRADAREKIVAAVAAGCAALQAAVMVHEHVGGSQTALTVANAVAVFVKFAGSYAFGGIARVWPHAASAALLAGALATLVVVAAAVRGARDARATVISVLVYLWAGATALSVARVNVGAPDPFWAGPRYFFYPFIFEGWLLVHVMLTAKPAWLVRTAAAGLVLAALGAVTAPHGAHDDLAWRANFDACRSMQGAQRYAIPVEYDGHAAEAWLLQLSGDQCRALAARDLLTRMVPALARPAPPYLIDRSASPPSALAVAPRSALVANGWKGTDFQRSRLPGLAVLGSYGASDADTGSITVRLRRGEGVWFRSGPAPYDQRIVVQGQGNRFSTVAPRATEWSVLRFARPDLPERFDVVFDDRGTGWGEWSAVALSAR